MAFNVPIYTKFKVTQNVVKILCTYFLPNRTKNTEITGNILFKPRSKVWFSMQDF